MYGRGKKMKKIASIICLSIVVITVMSTICPNYSYAISSETIAAGKSFGGKILEPVMDFFVTLCDGIIDIAQKVLFGVEGDAIVNIDRSSEGIAKALGIIAAIAVMACSIALAVIFSPVTSLAAAIFVGAGTAVLTIGKVIKTYFVITTIASAMLNNSFQIPFIVVSPENIIQNKIGMFNVNFFAEITDTDTNTEDNSINIADELHLTIAKWYYKIRNIVIVLFMILLIYIGIRILVASISEDKAKYKKMLVDWLISFVLVFVIHYIMIFSMYIVDEFTNLVSTVTNDESVEYFEIVDDEVYNYFKKNQNNYLRF